MLRKLRLAKQIKLIQLMNNLFAGGFHLTEIVDFLNRSNLTDKKFIVKMRTGLENGQNLSEILAALGFSQAVVTQLALAEIHGNIIETMNLVEKNLRKIEAVKKKLVSVATYPVILLVFLLLIMLGMKNYLIPQVANDDNSGKTNLAVEIVSKLPEIFLILTVIVAGLSLLIGLKIRYGSALRNYRLGARLPILTYFTQLYSTAYFAREWGVLISQGLELRQILDLSSSASSRIFSEAGQEIQEKMAAGKEFHIAVKQLRIFTSELPLIIEYGEMKGKLGRELMVYSDENWERFFQKIDRAMQLIQPLVFLFVALAIVLIYAAMLLPIYQNIDLNV
ncbi:competence type IV pilus assembly protein ComGB [Lactovum odontotermitis]